MKYVIMYLICGMLWALYIFKSFFDEMDNEEQERLKDIVDNTRKAMFKSGVMLDFNTVLKLCIGIAFLIYMVTWPYMLLDMCVIKKVRLHIKK